MKRIMKLQHSTVKNYPKSSTEKKSANYQHLFFRIKTRYYEAGESAVVGGEE